MKSIMLFIGSLSAGGAERTVSNLSLNLSSDIEKEIIIYGKNPVIDYPYGGQLVELDDLEKGNLLKKTYAFLYRIKAIKRMKRLYNNKTIVSFLEYPNLINLMTYKHGNTIISVRNHMSTKHQKGIKSFFWNMTIKFLYNKADSVIAVSKEIKKDLVNFYGIDKEKIRVIYNSYPIEKIKKLSQEVIEHEYKYIFDHPVIITVGSLTKQKGHWHLIRSFKKIKKEVPNAKLVILGDGHLKPYLKQLSIDLSIDKDVHFLGFQKNPFKYISSSKLFVLPSLYEGFPNALAEAMACGVPIVSSDCLSGPREILAPDEFNVENISYELKEDRYGVLIPVCNGIRYGAVEHLTKEEEIMAETMISLLKKQKVMNHFSSQALKRMEDFNLNNIIKEWESIL
ncbi:glycosyltransferase [Allobacillus sp. GCM10007491]|uniref:Glycosyltransferase n=1 Tax=Allobacillus saliphilus TaxID=2912308 RepID=A0A941HST0_9BACI|nr:glycosyltransferase [Allobacillus saliphilus]MBR7552549.1 glycosyltransferase [Allobacillus saliphilus]